MTAPAQPEARPPNPVKEIVQPFIDLVHAPRGLWGVNLAYAIEGLSYFGVLTYLVIYFSDFVFKGVPHADSWSEGMVGVLTGGISLSMVFLGFVPDKWGVRRALILSFVLLLVGRVVMSSAPTLLGLAPSGLWSPLHLITLVGIFFILVGYGIYQPAAYAAVRVFTTPKTAAMGYAMLYALMNLGSSAAMGAFLLRDDKFLGLGITGTFWVYTALTVVSLLVTVFVLSKRTVEETAARAKAECAALMDADPDREKKEKQAEQAAIAKAKAAVGTPRVPLTAWVSLAGIVAAVMWRVPPPWSYEIAGALLAVVVVIALLPAKVREPVLREVAAHPLADWRFFFLIFALLPVQTLFTYNWLVLPPYISRAYSGWIGEYYEVASNINPIFIFLLVPIITALTYKVRIYNIIVWGTVVMGSSAFVLALGPSLVTLAVYLLLMTVGEAMWSARFLQYATEIAPEGRAGQYQGVAQLPWFLTKFLVPILYAGKAMERYCPAEGPKDTQTMWFIFGLIAMVTPALLLVKGWLGGDFKTRAA